MEDNQIVDLYWERNESAIDETDKKYGKYCKSIAYNILFNEEDSKECVNDTYLKAWEAMPPHRPQRLATFLGKITRNISLNRYKYNHTDKRGGGQVPLVLDELQECIPNCVDTEKIADDMVLTNALNDFLGSLSVEARKIFMQRYWYMSSVAEIAKDYSISESKVKMSLLRSRNKLKKLLEKEGVAL